MLSTCLQTITMTVFRHENGLKLRQKVRAVIVNPAGEFLLVRPHGYREGEWTLAGGGVEQGETVHEAMQREIAEELGVTLEDSPERLPVANRFIYGANYKENRSLDHDGQHATMFVVRLPQETRLTLQAEEVAEARWFSRDDAEFAFPVSEQREIFRDCVAAISA